LAWHLLRHCWGEGNQVFRLGGDEFVVIIADCGDPRVVAGVVEKMLKRLAQPFASMIRRSVSAAARGSPSPPSTAARSRN
jgi:GGDEF domain-containing protein